jgi:hypothetical protein
MQERHAGPEQARVEDGETHLHAVGHVVHAEGTVRDNDSAPDGSDDHDHREPSALATEESSQPANSAGGGQRLMRVVASGSWHGGPRLFPRDLQAAP